ncbi:hypothetical protein METH_21915 (plasmid) [Leisingera methylohalidivorans DSM 14336]|uniref:Uncharacterized protein n=1 Tax=Leisingera methylohalidivorans DSM 14336 TaxID=999552 RepID=V9VXL9_9RHOB|nr:hypothetical protein METH_21915 [Leisingera methylohalidivorans DSM 14336]
MMAISRGQAPDQIKEDPGIITINSVNSPRLFDDAMGNGLIAMAEDGQPVTVTPFTLMGAMTPVDLQAAYETMMATWGAVLGGANTVYHAAGWLEAAKRKEEIGSGDP